MIVTTKKFTDTNYLPSLPGTLGRSLFQGIIDEVVSLFNADTSKANVLQPTIVAPTLLNSWVNVGNENVSAGYYTDTLGIIHCVGDVSGGAITDGIDIFSLPLGSRPSNTHTFNVASGSSVGSTNITVNADGTVSIYGANGNNTYLSLDGISFKAEQ